MVKINSTASTWATRQTQDDEVLAYENGDISTTKGATRIGGGYWQDVDSTHMLLFNALMGWRGYRWDAAKARPAGDDGWVEVDMDVELNRPMYVA